MKIKDLIENINIGEATVFDLAAEADGGKKLTVTMQRSLPPEPRQRVRAESPAKAHAFLDAYGLGQYLAKYGTKDTVAFADPVNERIVAVLDETAKGGYERVSMAPAVHPLWKPWKDLIADGAVDVKKFADFVNEHRRDIVSAADGAPDGRELALAFRQIKASQHVERMSGKGKNAINGLMVTSKIQGIDKSEPVELPDSFTVDLPLYVGMSKEQFTLDLSLDVDDDAEITVTVTAAAIAEARVRQFEEMARIVRGLITEKGATVVLGAPGHAAWAYLEEVK